MLKVLIFVHCLHYERTEAIYLNSLTLITIKKGTKKTIMNEDELKRKAIEWLESQSKAHQTRPQSFRPIEIANAIGGYAGSLGNVADAVVTELISRDIKIRYLRIGKKCRFELL